VKKIQYISSLMITTLIITFHGLSAYAQTRISQHKAVVIENFDDGSVLLSSYPGEDMNPTSWQLNTTITYDNSPFSLRLYGNTWKVENIETLNIFEGTVWQVSAYTQSESEIQGFGLSDGLNTLFYSFAGGEEVALENWVTVYQGAFNQGQWNDYQLPIADDWLDFFGYLPQITSLVYVNDNDYYSPGVVYFDQIMDISEDLPIIPDVSISYTIGSSYKTDGKLYVDVQFFSEIYDPDSQEHVFYWNFGDGNTSIEENPMHTYILEDDHPYSVLLQEFYRRYHVGQKL
jgi:PKD repeat protein